MRRWIAIPMMALTVAFAGCDEDVEPLEPEPFAELTGEFEAESFVFAADDDPALNEDLIGAGATFEFRVEEDGDVFTTLTRANGDVVTTRGMLEEQNGIFMFRETTGDMRTFELTRTGENLLLERTEAQFDFDDDGVLDDADFEALLSPSM